MDDFSDIEASAHHQFKDGEYFLSMVTQKSKTLKIHVEDIATGEQWNGNFDSSYIEELTHKTGNFKEFNIFCTMLESGISKTSESITLKLMTYTDLEALRSKKAAAKRKDAAPNTALSNKRYLIITYTVEFDRIHYPLSLSYVGKFDPVSMRKLFKQQKEEIRDLKSQLQNLHSAPRISRDRSASFERLIQEKEELENELEMCRNFLSKNSVVKELRILKKVITNLESDLLKERSKHQRVIFKKNDECKRLAEELEEVKRRERNLQFRVKNLTNEIAILKKTPSRSPQMKLPIYANRWAKNPLRQRSSSKERVSNTSIDRKYTTPSPSGRFDPTAYIQEKKQRQQESERRRSRSGSRTLHRSRSASLERVTSSQSRERPPTKTRSSSSRDQPRRAVSHSSSIGSIGSRHSSADSATRRFSSATKRKTPSAFSSRERQRSLSKKEARKSVLRSALSSGESEAEISYRNKDSRALKRRDSKSKTGSKHKYKDDKEAGAGREDANETLDKSLNIADIDARLSALQMFMKSNLDDM
ncbi:centrosomal protein CCDC61-like [Rhopilema esculentum]|uniref:centrosomal protein CCDC61-like n=1 Tax=Rhopilema esculentum TaxID=499914 RepID=UPI0031D42246